MPLALFPADRQLPDFAAGFGVQVRLKEMELHRPRQWFQQSAMADLLDEDYSLVEAATTRRLITD